MFRIVWECRASSQGADCLCKQGLASVGPSGSTRILGGCTGVLCRLLPLPCRISSESGSLSSDVSDFTLIRDYVKRGLW